MSDINERMIRLQGHELHGIEPTVETGIERVKEQNSGGVTELSTLNWGGQISSNSRKYLYLADISNREIAMIDRKQLSELIALLQRAKEIMMGGG